MKTDAPGQFSCDIYLQAWVMGDRRPGSDVMEHIDNCWFCCDLVHGGTDEFPLSIEEEAQQRIEAQDREAARISRRDLFRMAGAVVGSLSLAAMGGASFLAGAPSRVDTARSRKFSNLDKRLFLRGPSDITKLIDAGSPVVVGTIFEWVVDRRHSQFYGRIAGAVLDPRQEVQMHALRALLRIPPLDLRPHAPQLDAARDQVTDPLRSGLLSKILDRVKAP